MFKMIGGDGREYGPMSADQLREWIAEVRANGQTLVQAEGASEWKPLSAYPEFDAALAAAAAASEPLPSAEAEGAPPSILELLQRDSKLNVGDCLGRGWLLLREHPFLLIASTSLVWLVVTLGPYAGCAGGVLSLVLSGALHGGLMLVYLKLIRQEPASLTDIFACFGAGFGQLLLIWVVTHFLSGLGMMLWLLPGIYLKVIWAFSLPIAAERGLGFWHALELSRQMVSRQWLQVTALLAVAYLPVIVFAAYSAQQIVAYWLGLVGGSFSDIKWDELIGHFKQVTNFASKLALPQQIVLLLNLPFAYAALMYAYEDLFGLRRTQDR